MTNVPPAFITAMDEFNRLRLLIAAAGLCFQGVDDDALGELVWTLQERCADFSATLKWLAEESASSTCCAPSAIADLFDRWDGLMVVSGGLSDDEAERLAEKRYEVEDRLFAEPIRSRRDLAVKIVVSTHYNALNLPDFVYDEIATIAGAA